MQIVILTAIGVGLASVFGSVLSFFIKEVPHKISDMIMAFAAGVMLAATFFSLIAPALEYNNGLLLCLPGLIAGAYIIYLIDRFMPHIHSVINMQPSNKKERDLDRVTLFLIAIAIHNLPEGMAVGVSFGNANIGNTFAVAMGISIQNIPEGLIAILPLVLLGISKKKVLLLSAITGLSATVGVFVGYFTVSISDMLLPFVLSLAAGTMLYVISHDMIPETHSHGHENEATFSLIVGVIVMLILNSLFV